MDVGLLAQPHIQPFGVRVEDVSCEVDSFAHDLLTCV